MLQNEIKGLKMTQFDSFEIDIDTNESFYFELKSSTLNNQINDIDNF
jgi:hypothetical protein